MRPRGKRVIVIGVSWTTAAHLTEQADVEIYYDLDIEPFGEHAASRENAPALTEPKKLEPAVAAAADDAVSGMEAGPGPEVDRRKVAEALDLILTITREHREAGQELTVSVLGQELQKRMRPADFQQVGKGKALTYARALEKAGKLKIVTHDFVDHLFMPYEPAELINAVTNEAPPREAGYDYGGLVYYDLTPPDREAVIAKIQEERTKPGNDWLTFNRTMTAVRSVVDRDDGSLKNLVNSMISAGVIRHDQTRTRYDPETKKQFTYPTFALDYQHPDVRRTLKLG
jgi:hypothetical protein